ncbi:RNA-directed DNA polymerase, eukaryota, reverse transcriptase zinc-binding domain protein [Tanacetum coccineum]|uniref:RNA-directed DNA polymerase, eukaryota, reverse transcriptase zinc-binding domain protein n=1 Tax=Tanacetum coccineum TaxID=301880 RepID=A0ABQ5HSK8_9ASTR
MLEITKWALSQIFMETTERVLTAARTFVIFGAAAVRMTMHYDYRLCVMHETTKLQRFVTTGCFSLTLMRLYLYFVPKKSTLKSFMDSLSDYKQFTIEQTTMSNKLCYLDVILVWRFRTQNASLRAKFIKGIHGNDGKLGSIATHHHPSIWLDIVREVESLKHQGIDLSVKLSRNSMDHSSRRAPREGIEQTQFNALLTNIDGINLADMMDRWVWTLEGSGEFSVASIRRLIDKRILPEVSTKTRWITGVPIKVNIHAWKVKLDCLPTRLNIDEVKLLILFYVLCEKAVESSNHTFFICHIARDVFRKINHWWDISFMEVSSYEEWLNWLLNLRLHSKHKHLLERVCLRMSWLVLLIGVVIGVIDSFH